MNRWVASSKKRVALTGRTSRMSSTFRAPRPPVHTELLLLNAIIDYGATTAVPAARPRAALPRLYSSKPPTTSGGDFVDSLAGEPREMSTEERISALQREIAAQVR